MNLLQTLEKEELERVTTDRRIDEFDAGDTVRVNVKIIEGSTERIQAFEGVCIARKDRGIHSSFTVRKISNGEGVERIFPLYGPRVDSVELIRKGDVRRAKLYYLRGRTGKAARIKEKMDFGKTDMAEVKAKQEARQEARKAKKAEGGKKAKAKKAAPADKSEA